MSQIGKFKKIAAEAADSWADSRDFDEQKKFIIQIQKLRFTKKKYIDELEVIFNVSAPLPPIMVSQLRIFKLLAPFDSVKLSTPSPRSYNPPFWTLLRVTISAPFDPFSVSIFPTEILPSDPNVSVSTPLEPITLSTSVTKIFVLLPNVIMSLPLLL